MQYGVVAILYWPIMGFLILLGSRLDKRYPAGSVQRNRADRNHNCHRSRIRPVQISIWFVVAAQSCQLRLTTFHLHPGPPTDRLIRKPLLYSDHSGSMPPAARGRRDLAFIEYGCNLSS
jgi:hypothetical protein